MQDSECVVSTSGSSRVNENKSVNVTLTENNNNSPPQKQQLQKRIRKTSSDEGSRHFLKYLVKNSKRVTETVGNSLPEHKQKQCESDNAWVEDQNCWLRTKCHEKLQLIGEILLCITECREVRNAYFSPTSKVTGDRHKSEWRDVFVSWALNSIIEEEDQGIFCFLLRNISYFMTTTWLPRNEKLVYMLFAKEALSFGFAASNVLIRFADLLVEHVVKLARGKRLRKVSWKQCVRTNATGLRLSNCFNKFLACLKSHVMTRRFVECQKPSFLSSRVDPGANFGFRVALLTAVVNGMAFVKTEDLITVVRKIAEYMMVDLPKKKLDDDDDDNDNDECEDKTKKELSLLVDENPLLNDLDLIHFATVAVDALRYRLKVKLLEINDSSCTCHAKCYGMIGGRGAIENVVYGKIEKVNFGRLVCGHCRLCPSVKNSNSRKPSRTMTPCNPAADVCSVDGCSVFKHVDLVKTVANKSGVFVSHKFYSTNTSMFTKVFLRKNQVVAGHRILGICFGGKRTCKTAVSQFMSSSLVKKKKKSSSGADKEEDDNEDADVAGDQIKDICKWSRCAACSDVAPHLQGRQAAYCDDKFGNPMSPATAVQNSFFSIKGIHENSCLYEIFRHYRLFGGKLVCDFSSQSDCFILKEKVNLLCKGCCAALLCHHVLNGCVNFIVRHSRNHLTDIQRFTEKLKFICKIRKMVVEKLHAQTGENVLEGTSVATSTAGCMHF